MRISSFLLTISILLIATECTKIYVSPAGSDITGNGTKVSPFQSLIAAQKAARNLRGTTPHVRVILREGTHTLLGTLHFTEMDSGVTYEAYQGELVTISGGTRVTGWTKVNSYLWSARLPNSVADTRQLYVNGRRAEVTSQGIDVSKGTLTSTGYIVPASAVPNLQSSQQDPTTIEFLYTGVGSSWTECHLRASKIETLPNGMLNISMQQPGFYYGINRPYGQGVTFPVAVTNVFSLLTSQQQGKYYLNTATRTLYYVPLPKENMNTAETFVPHLDVLLTAKGTTNFELKGMKFEYAGWLEPNGGLGYVDMQSAYRVVAPNSNNDADWAPVPGNIILKSVQLFTIQGCVFQHLGATAVQVYEGSQSVFISNNTFRDLSCSSVLLGQVNDVNQTNPTKQNVNISFVNNLVDHIPVEYRDCAGIMGGYLLHSSIANNTILSPPNTGISLGWGWSRDQATNAGYNRIVGNYVNGSNWLLEDGGSIYVLGPQPASLMAENYVSHQQKLYGALYTDEGSAYWHITRNVVHDVPEWLHIWTSSIHDEVVDYCWSDQTYQIVAGTRITISNITFVQQGQPFPPEAQRIMALAGVTWQRGPKN